MSLCVPELWMWSWREKRRGDVGNVIWRSQRSEVRASDLPSTRAVTFDPAWPHTCSKTPTGSGSGVMSFKMFSLSFTLIFFLCQNSGLRSLFWQCTPYSWGMLSQSVTCSLNIWLRMFWKTSESVVPFWRWRQNVFNVNSMQNWALASAYYTFLYNL